MAALTRNRATPGHILNALMREYYEQRASFGLIITEGTSPSTDGLGYARIPGIFDAPMITAWWSITDAVHAADGQFYPNAEKGFYLKGGLGFTWH